MEYWRCMETWTDSTGRSGLSPVGIQPSHISLRWWTIKTKIYSWGLLQVFACVATYLYLNSRFVIRIRKAGEVFTGIGESVEGSIEMWMLKTGRTTYQRSQGSGLYNLQALTTHEYSAVFWEEGKNGRKLDQYIFNTLWEKKKKGSSKVNNGINTVFVKHWCGNWRAHLWEGILNWNWSLVITLDWTNPLRK